MAIEVKPTELEKIVYDFWLDGTNFILDRYEVYNRETTKHKYVRKVKYDRCSHRDNNITEAEIEIPQEIKDKVIADFIKHLQVIKWSERKR